jgi:hypothetical protein
MKNRILWGLGVGLVGFAVSRYFNSKKGGHLNRSYSADARRHEELVDLSSEDSFPASDPPSYTPMQTVGSSYKK